MYTLIMFASEHPKVDSLRVCGCTASVWKYRMIVDACVAGARRSVVPLPVTALRTTRLSTARRGRGRSATSQSSASTGTDWLAGLRSPAATYREFIGLWWGANVP